MKIASYVFFDIETTGLPYQERNQTKITELSFVAASRNDLKKAPIGKKPYVSKLILLFNPQRRIHPDSSAITGLTNEMLKNAPIFGDKAGTIISFLNFSLENWIKNDFSFPSDVDPFVSPQISVNTLSPKKRCVKKETVKVKLSFKLTDLYKRLLHKKVAIAHRAEDDCMMLLECVVAEKEFLIWTDKHCKSIHDIKPLVRYG
ncbi:unnamed protein product [Arctia plantaginis]|uniref:Exonuclease domain-containing protein n=1 Tax=Arctia plantaginis TaxID=874455 RepID=A0A8S1AQX1_ARCPL|nr:unnamed protein product [Arctia plantaginis]